MARIAIDFTVIDLVSSIEIVSECSRECIIKTDVCIKNTHSHFCPCSVSKVKPLVPGWVLITLNVPGGPNDSIPKNIISNKLHIWVAVSFK